MIFQCQVFVSTNFISAAENFPWNPSSCRDHISTILRITQYDIYIWYCLNYKAATEVLNPEIQSVCGGGSEIGQEVHDGSPMSPQKHHWKWRKQNDQRRGCVYSTCRRPTNGDSRRLKRCNRAVMVYWLQQLARERPTNQWNVKLGKNSRSICGDLTLCRLLQVDETN